MLPFFFVKMLSRRVKDGLIAGGVHLLLSALIAVFVFAVVQRTWFMPPWDHLLHGADLLVMVIGVDVVCGPLLTGLVVHSAKARWKNLLDIGIIACVQVAALIFGMWTAWQAKPSWLVFDGDRFVAVRYADLLVPDGKKTSDLPKPSFSGISFLGVQPLDGSDTQFLPSLNLSLQGIPPAYRPERWVAYAEKLPAVSLAAKERADWMERIRQQQLQPYTLQPGIAFDAARPAFFVPLQIGAQTDWVVLIDPATQHPFAVMHADAWADSVTR